MNLIDIARCLADYVDSVNAHDVTRMLADRHLTAMVGRVV